MRAILYVANGCPHCAALRDELQRSGATFEEINVSARRERIPELLKLTRGKRIVPVLVDAGGVRVAPFGGTIF
jgi:glutaredoxin